MAIYRGVSWDFENDPGLNRPLPAGWVFGYPSGISGCLIKWGQACVSDAIRC